MIETPAPEQVSAAQVAIAEKTFSPGIVVVDAITPDFHFSSPSEFSNPLGSFHTDTYEPEYVAIDLGWNLPATQGDMFPSTEDLIEGIEEMLTEEYEKTHSAVDSLPTPKEAVHIVESFLEDAWNTLPFETQEDQEETPAPEPMNEAEVLNEAEDIWTQGYVDFLDRSQQTEQGIILQPETMQVEKPHAAEITPVELLSIELPTTPEVLAVQTAEKIVASSVDTATETITLLQEIGRADAVTVVEEAIQTALDREETGAQIVVEQQTEQTSEEAPVFKLIIPSPKKDAPQAIFVEDKNAQKARKHELTKAVDKASKQHHSTAETIAGTEVLEKYTVTPAQISQILEREIREDGSIVEIIEDLKHMDGDKASLVKQIEELITKKPAVTQSPTGEPVEPEDVERVLKGI
jgi:hypothetical protein